MYSKADLYNLALGALLLQRNVTDPATDKTNEVKVLNTHWDSAFGSALAAMDLDSTSVVQQLELFETSPTSQWAYAYKYPSNCAFFRRVQSPVALDTRYTRIPLRIAMYKGQKVIFCNEYQAVGELIALDIPLTALNPMAGQAVAYRLALLSAPLVTGKGSKSLRDQLDVMYKAARAEAQAQDRLENFNYETDEEASEFVNERMS